MMAAARKQKLVHSDKKRARIVEEALRAKSTVKDLAEKHGVVRSMLYGWIAAYKAAHPEDKRNYLQLRKKGKPKKKAKKATPSNGRGLAPEEIREGELTTKRAALAIVRRCLQVADDPMATPARLQAAARSLAALKGLVPTEEPPPDVEYRRARADREGRKAEVEAGTLVEARAVGAALKALKEAWEYVIRMLREKGHEDLAEEVSRETYPDPGYLPSGNSVKTARCWLPPRRPERASISSSAGT